VTTSRALVRTHAMLGDKAGATSWDMARERLANPTEGQTSWLSTVRPGGRPHLMPLIAFWIDDAFYFVAGEGTRKARNLAAQDRCVIATTSTKLPSIDIVVEGRAEALTDHHEVRRIAEAFASKKWPLEVRGAQVYGPNAPTAGPAPYSIFRMVPARAYGLPGMQGMEQFKPEELPKPTRWDFD
jgi:nitroimidazol reductase NimA-like FMN-containing flavoprotein (pyridoxamine 5'-phosphate oxidase superfamily)